MEVYLDDKELKKLYETGKSRKLRLPEHIIDKFFATVQKIESAVDIHDLLADRGLRFELLKNTDRYSMRLNNQYRLEMNIEWENEANTIGVFLLLTISNHYS
ncbi:type II toxin-antitoxin system RelE/ParE family toxin [Marinoscillum sp.]|uniref:type II toxin-antitoxin system RelE/ParE family toxin n=1 Tax=Marinoscillum sp. TaxID=2024838 RepID=UPI003BABC5AF